MGFMRFHLVGRFAQWLMQPGGVNPAITVDIELLDADGLMIKDADGKILLAADQVFGLTGGEWFLTADNKILGVNPA